MKEGPPPHRLRRLSDEEIALWTEVARSVSRRRGASLPTPAKPLPAKPQAPPADDPGRRSRSPGPTKARPRRSRRSNGG